MRPDDIRMVSRLRGLQLLLGPSLKETDFVFPIPHDRKNAISCAAAR